MAEAAIGTIAAGLAVLGLITLPRAARERRAAILATVGIFLIAAAIAFK